MLSSIITIPAASVTPSRTLRERCGFTEYISFAPAFPNIPAKGHLGPTAGNLPRRKRSSVASLDIPVPAPIPVVESSASRGDHMKRFRVHRILCSIFRRIPAFETESTNPFQ
ncbi:hypothetical protein DFH06DRAFT_1333490 [Mycena polygramma]|nr:hypothetical protein DFH06DRAFT_1333490 [Mycena polygramma]